MVKLTEEQIKFIAEELEMGVKCFYNKQTNEIKSIPDFEGFYVDDDEIWSEMLNEIEENQEQYVVFEKMDSRRSFEIMHDFVHTIDDLELQNRLFEILNMAKPFKNFKWKIDNSGEYRKKWFSFKTQRYIEWVEECLAEINEFKDD